MCVRQRKVCDSRNRYEGAGANGLSCRGSPQEMDEIQGGAAAFGLSCRASPRPAAVDHHVLDNGTTAGLHAGRGDERRAHESEYKPRTVSVPSSQPADQAFVALPRERAQFGANASSHSHSHSQAGDQRLEAESKAHPAQYVQDTLNSQSNSAFFQR